MTAPLIFTPEYYERMRLLEGSSWWNAGMRDIAEMLLNDVALPERGTLLDVGCGSGHAMAWFEAMRPKWNIVGLDVAREALDSARSLGARVCQGWALKLPLASGSVDLAITLDVLQHLPLDGGDVEAMREIRRVLKPGGYLFIRTNAQAFPRTDDDPAFHFRKYEPHELRARLTEAGFAILRLSRVNSLLGLAEIPRELRARRMNGRGYHGLLAMPKTGVADWLYDAKRRWLGFEGRLVRGGVTLPFGRSIVALCKACP